MFIRLISSEGDKEENFSVPTRNQTSTHWATKSLPWLTPKRGQYVTRVLLTATIRNVKMLYVWTE